MIVQAKCIQRAWDSTQARLYVPNDGPLPGGLYELDLANPAHRKLVDLKTQMKQFIFQFDRMAANDAASGLYFCSDCGDRFDSLSLIGNHMKQVHKRTGWGTPKPEPEPELEVEEATQTGLNAAGDVRGLGPRHCKGCGQAFDSLNALVRHKPDCPGKLTEPVGQESSKEVTQEATV